MIRYGRAKGSRRRCLVPLAGLIFAAAAGGAGRPAPAGGPGWWEVRLSVAAKGAFTIRGGGQSPVSGEYVLRARFEGRLNPDGDDFVLVHLKTETLEWRLRRTSGPGEAVAVREAPEARAPVLRLNYVLRERDRVELDFTFEGQTVPLPSWPAGVPLELPASARGAAAGRPGYVGDVLSGSNRIVLPASDLARRRPERTFAWTWTGTRLIEAGGRAYVTFQSHSAEAVVGLGRH
jgi:hypothetical protein